jgi:hypothetical protein
MIGKERRKELLAEYKQTHPEAGVYRIVNKQNNKALLGSSPNLAGVHNKIDFAKSTGMTGVLDHRLRRDVNQFGIEAFSVEVLDVLEIKPEMTIEQVRHELSILEALWRQKVDPSLLY